MREATKLEEKIYGIYVFFLLHGKKGTRRWHRKTTRLNSMLKGTGLFGRNASTIPEAKEIYVKLIRKFGLKSEVNGID